MSRCYSALRPIRNPQSAIRIRAGEAQTVLEYAVLIAALCAAIVTMGVYGKRALQGRLKVNADAIGGTSGVVGSGLVDKVREQEEKFKVNRTAVPGELFSPRWSNYEVTVTETSRARQTSLPSGESRSELLDHAVTNVEGFFDDFSDKPLTKERLFE